MTGKRAVLPLLALSLGLFACKQEDPTVDSGVADEKLGSDLTPAEQTQLCEAVFEFEAELLPPAEAKSATCTLAGVAFALLGDGSADSCNTIRTSCLNEPGEEGGGGGMCSLGIDWETCMASVGEIEDCREENSRATIAALKAVSCAKMEEYKANPPDMDEPALGEKCSLAQAKCSTVLGAIPMP